MSAADPFAPGFLSRLAEPPRKVVLVRPSRIGDFICATPAFRALRAALPEAVIAMITLPLLEDLVLRSPHLDRFIAFPGFPGLAEQFFDARRVTRFLQEVQAEEFDLAIQLQGSGVYANPFTLLLGAKATAGFIQPFDKLRACTERSEVAGSSVAHDPGWPGRLDAALPLPNSGHEAQRVLALPLFLGATAQGETPEYPLWPEDHLGAEALLAKVQRPLIGLHPGAWDSGRRWLPGRFAAVANQLQQQYGGSAIILGSQQTQPLAKAVADAIDGRHLNLAGQTSLGLLGGIVSRLAVLITNDSGPAHVAYALGAPTVTLFGPSDPTRYGPFQDGPFRLVRPAASDAVEDIAIPQVVAAVHEVIREQPSVAQPSVTNHLTSTSQP